MEDEQAEEKLTRGSVSLQNANAESKCISLYIMHKIYICSSYFAQQIQISQKKLR